MSELKVEIDREARWNCVDVVPDGEYVATIVKSDVRLSRSHRSQCMRLLLKIAEGEFRGYQLYDCTFLKHSHLTPVLRGRAKLSTLCQATGVAAPGDTSQFHDIPISIIVRNRYDRHGRPTSEVCEWKRICE